MSPDKLSNKELKGVLIIILSDTPTAVRTSLKSGSTTVASNDILNAN